MSVPNEILTVEQLCELLCVGRKAAYDLLESHRIKAFKIGRKWKIPFASVEEYIEERRQNRELENEYRRKH